MRYRLYVRIMHFIRAMMYRRTFGVLREEERMVVHPFIFTVDVHKASDFRPIGSSEDIRSFQIEPTRVEVVSALKTADQESEVPQLVYWARPLFKATNKSRQAGCSCRVETCLPPELPFAGLCFRKVNGGRLA